jgi:TRAP-type C4-dicarboxylate transport system permease small subunit
MSAPARTAVGPSLAAGPMGRLAREPDRIVSSFAEADQHHVDLRPYIAEDWICLVFFWLMAALVFLQFFSRYVLNDSFAWTEELAVYCLMPVVFIGSAACVRRSRHIQVNLMYRYLPRAAGRVAATLVDLVNTVCFGYVAWLMGTFALAMDAEPMTTIAWSKSHVYWLAFAGMALMALRSAQVSWIHWRQGYSALERPEAYDGTAVQEN